MYTKEEMNKWSYSKAWRFFTTHAVKQYIPETEEYVRSLNLCPTIDIRYDNKARNQILNSVKNKKTLILIDGASLNGKTTFAGRLAKTISAEVVDIDILCKEWFDEKFKSASDIEKYSLMVRFDQITDDYIFDNLEEIIKEKSKQTTILVGSYMEIIYRAIIARTLGKYFDQVVSIYMCSKSFGEVDMMLQKREAEYQKVPGMRERVFRDYHYSRRLLEAGGVYLGFGFKFSFIADITVSDMFKK